MTPGALLLGNPGQYFECEHRHGAGDRCISFRYAPDVFARIAADAGARGRRSPFRSLRLPPVRGLSPVVARACAGLVGAMAVSWEELGVELAARTAAISGGLSRGVSGTSRDAVARVTRIVRTIERHPEGDFTLDVLAKGAELSPYHFLRTFAGVTGVTPHQYLLRCRLREAATRLSADPSKVLDIALDCGFGDISNFNHAFRAEFGVAPRAFRAGAGLRRLSSRPPAARRGRR
jgi:AraC-like DNA-binding protein